MKNTILLAAFLLVSITAELNAQTVSIAIGDSGIAAVKDSIAQITLFTAKYKEGTTYLHWDVVNQHKGGVYLIFRSVDGGAYESIGYKQGIGVPISLPIAYYFQDQNPQSGVSSYKVVHVGMDNSYLVSKNFVIMQDIQFSQK